MPESKPTEHRHHYVIYLTDGEFKHSPWLPKSDAEAYKARKVDEGHRALLMAHTPAFAA
jgi:hypothetical protein